MAPRRPRVVIAGMGDTGTLVAIGLARRAEVVGVTTRPALVSGQELGNRLTDPKQWDRNFLVPLDRFRRLDRIRTVHGRILRADLDRSRVEVELAAGGRQFVPYDALVLASGVTNGFWRHDRVQDQAAIDAELAAGRAAVRAARTVAVVGGGATGVSVAASLARRHRGQAVHLFFGRDEPLPGYHPRARRRIVAELNASGVHLHPGHRAVAPPPDQLGCLAPGSVEWTTGQAPFDADLVLWTLGQVHPHTGFLPAEVLDGDGFVTVDDHLQVPGYPNVFAVGDVAASDPDRSSARNWGYLVIARNVAARLAGRPDRMRRYRAPEHRWGSILGQQDDGMLVFQPDGRTFRVPSWAVQPLLFDFWLRTVLSRGVRRS